MHRLLDNLDILSKIIDCSPFGFITDIDGTISPSSSDPMHIAVPAENLLNLARIVPRFALVAVISGRATAEIRNLINIPGIRYYGHYGMEWDESGSMVVHPDAVSYLPDVRSVAAMIGEITHLEGLVVQDKGLTISLHYRRSPDPARTRDQIYSWLSRCPAAAGLRIIEEKMVVGILPPVAYDKGNALSKLIDDHSLKGAIFLGDDTADVPGFRVVRKFRVDRGFEGYGVLVTGKETPAEIIPEADFHLDGVAETSRLLAWLAGQ